MYRLKNIQSSEQKLATIFDDASLATPEFGSRAESVYNLLVSEFFTDYFCRKLLPASCGWRTLSRISKTLKIPKHQFYGRNRRPGPALAVLLGCASIETSITEGQRGRGGEIFRIRVDLGTNEKIKEACLSRIASGFPSSSHVESG